MTQKIHIKSVPRPFTTSLFIGVILFFSYLFTTCYFTPNPIFLFSVFVIGEGEWDADLDNSHDPVTQLDTRSQRGKDSILGVKQHVLNEYEKKKTCAGEWHGGLGKFTRSISQNPKTQR